MKIFQLILLFVMTGGALLILFMVFTELVNFLQTRVPFVPTSKKDIADMVHRVGITQQDLFLDLGSGNGKVVFAVEQLTGAKARGLQRGGWTQIYAKLRKRLTGSKAELVTGNFFNQPWSDATVIYCYLYPHLMNQVADKAKHDCKPGTKIVVRDFPIPNLQLHSSWQTPTYHDMYLYILD